jgi:N-acetylglutamate synthase-like GNAT family acetyltransferase
LITYRKATIDDLENMYPLLADFCEETKSDEDALERIVSNILDEKTTSFIAENGRICGVIGALQLGERALPDFFYVIPEMRGKTVGGKLFVKGSAYMKTLGVKKFIPLVSEELESMYTKLGFKRKFIMLEKEI